MVNKAGRKGFESGGGGGTVVSHHNTNRGFGPFPARGVTSVTSTSTLLAGGNAGVTVVSGSSALTLTMPLASEAVGATYVFRNLSDTHAHILTGSQEEGGTRVFSIVSGTAFVSGSRLTMGNAVGDAVVLMCDGVRFHVIGGSGSIAGA